MKKIILSVSAFMLSMQLMAQAPEKMSYQAVVRNSSNALVQNGSVGMRISILEGSASGTPVYVETQSATTNNNGLASVMIGSGTVVSGDISTIDWSTGDYFLQTETDPTGGTNYTVSGTSQLLSVPYALHAKTAESVINDQVDDADADPMNEIELPSGGNNAQVLSTDGTGNYSWVDQTADELPSGGNSDQVLSTDGIGNYSWVDQTVNTLPDGTAVGQTAHWNGTAWVADATIYNDGTNVGIGNSTPNGKLAVGSAIGAPLSWNPVAVISDNNAEVLGIQGSNVSSNINFYKNGSSTRQAIIASTVNASGSDLGFRTTSAAGAVDQLRMTINADGNIGIGTSIPSERLDVLGSMKFTGALMPGNNAGTTGQVLTSAGAGTAPTWTTPASATNIYNTNGTLTGNRTVAQGTNTLAFTGSAVNAFSVDGTTLSVDATNNRVGVNNAAPANDLHVTTSSLGGGVTVSGPTPGYRLSPTAGATIAFGAANIANEWATGSAANDAVLVNQHTTGKLIFATGTTAAARMTISQTGNVGIGTTAPNGKLAVGSAIGAPLSWNPVAVISDNNAEVLGIQGSNASSNINFYKNGSTVRQAIIASSVNGSGSDLGFRTTSSVGSVDLPRMIIKADGNVGIGTMAPARMLHVSDAMRLEPIAIAPASPSAGDMYFSSVTNKLMVFDGTVWQACW